MLTFDRRHDLAEHELLRQGYLLTGDPDQAAGLAERALAAARARGRHGGPAAVLEDAKAELVRAFVALPPVPRPPAGPPATRPDVAVWGAIRRLPSRRRAAVVLRYDEGLTEEQTADRLGTSEQAVRADVDAAMLTLRTALPGVEDPWAWITEALNAAGRGWSEYTRPAPGRVAEVLAAPPPQPRRREGAGRGLRAGLAATGVAAVLLAAALIVPKLGGDPVATAPAAVGVGQQVAPRQAPRLVVPTRDVPKGLLNWPARGTSADDPALLTAATAAWRAGAPTAEDPATGTGVLWAGRLQGRPVVVLQSLDRAGHPHVAQVAGRPGGALALQHAEPLHAGTAVLSLLPPAGPSGPVRVLVSPEAQIADGLLASNPMNGMPLRPTPVGVDGVSGVLPSPPGTPTCSRVVLLGLDYAGGPASGSRVLYSGVVSADMLGGMPMEVEVGSPTLAPAADARPETGWFTDGEKLAPKVPGASSLTVATLGPPLPQRALSATDRRIVSSRAYELRRGSTRYVGSVVEVAGKTVCASVSPVTPGVSAWALRCPVPGGTTGVVHVVGTGTVQSVDLALAATPAPAGQRPYAATVQRPADAPADRGFAVLQVVASGFPCGAGTVTVHGSTGETTLTLPVYRP